MKSGPTRHATRPEPVIEIDFKVLEGYVLGNVHRCTQHLGSAAVPLVRRCPACSYQVLTPFWHYLQVAKLLVTNLSHMSDLACACAPTGELI